MFDCLHFRSKQTILLFVLSIKQMCIGHGIQVAARAFVIFVKGCLKCLLLLLLLLLNLSTPACHEWWDYGYAMCAECKCPYI